MIKERMTEVEVEFIVDALFLFVARYYILFCFVTR